MKTTSYVTVIGAIAGTPERKTINNKALAEFRVEDIGLRISAWEARADAVPSSGVVIVSGYLHTRTYTHDNQERMTTEIRATTVQTLDLAPAIDSDLPF